MFKNQLLKWVFTLLIFTHFKPTHAQPDWSAIKSNASFVVHDTNFFSTPQIQPLNVGGWEDGLYITRDGKHLYSTYAPIDLFSWLFDFSICMDFNPYYRGPLFDIDTVTNSFGCTNYMHSDIVWSSRSDSSQAFTSWESSDLANPFTFDGGACGVLKSADTFDVFVFTSDTGPNGVELMFLRDVPVNAPYGDAVPILSSPAAEDNPHIERLDNGDLLLIFDRDRYMYYSLSSDNGFTWQTPTLITQVLNDQAPYDVQPHLWNDGQDWWVFFGQDNSLGIHCIYKSKQLIPGDWDSWGPKEIVIEPNILIGTDGLIYGIGEPTLTQWGDLSFVVVYGNDSQSDTTDVYDCDPWILKRKHPIATANTPTYFSHKNDIKLYPNPAQEAFQLSVPAEFLGGRLTISHLTGQMVLKCLLTSNQMSFSTDQLPNGIYLIQIQKNGLILNEKLIINR